MAHVEEVVYLLVLYVSGFEDVTASSIVSVTGFP